MGVHRYYGKAVRFNGYSDGLTVPTGQYRERGVKLRRPATTEPSNTEYSNATRTGRLHIPNETNPLNAIRGSLTIDAYIIPDLGGVVVHKEGSYKLEVGSPFGMPKIGVPTQAGTIKFTIYTSGKTHTIETNFDIRSYIHTQMYQYPDKRYKPQDMTLPRQQLMMVTAQFTEKEMKLYLNTGLVAEMSFGGDKLLLDGNSSDLFIGGRGGEYRGVIESVRISRGIVSPKLEPLTVLDETIGFWDFNDEIQIPEHYFYSHSQSGNPSAARDGPLSTNDGDFNVPGVFIGYDFRNIKNPTNNVEIGTFKIREPTPNAGGEEDFYRGTEKLASMFTGIPLKDIRKQSWYQSGTLRTSSDSTFRGLSDGGSESILRDYFDDAAPALPQSSMNLIINHSGTNPDSKTHRNPSSSIRYPYFDPTAVPPATVALYQEKIISTAPQRDLDPMVNPVERVRVVAIDFIGNHLWVSGVHTNNDASAAAPTQSIENRPVLSGLQYHHDDDTPVWVCLGNGDLVLDDGNKDTDQTAHPGQVTRAKDTFTRATFTQGQRFKDKSGNNNEAFFISKMSRTPITPPAHLPSDAYFTYFFNPPVGSSLYGIMDPDPPKASLIYWHDAKQKKLANHITGQVDLFRDLTGNYHDFHTDTNTDIWKWEEDSGFFGGRPSYVVNSGASTNGKSIVNMATADGSGKQITRSANGYTIFMLIRPAFHPTNNLRFFGVQGGANQSFIDMNVAANLTTFGNAGGGGTRPSTLQVGKTMLYAIRIHPGLPGHPLGLPNHVREYLSNVQLPTGVFPDGCINTFVDFSDGIFSLFGNVTAIDTAAKRGTTANYGAPPDFRWAEILIYDKSMTDAEMAQVNGYFLDKYGVI